MQTRTAGSIIAIALVVLGLAGCRNLPRGGLGRGPDIRTIAGVGARPDRLASEGRRPSTISSRVDPPPGEASPGRVIGQVVDDRGVPVANARVRLAVDGASGGREVQGTTNRSGQFLLKGLRPGERYTLIAEWDDGRELLLGRSSVSVPADEVRIRVASAGRSDRAEVTSGTRFESSGIALFSPEPRDPEVDRTPPPAEEDPALLAPDRAASEPSRSRSGWIPTDSVRRASLDPSRDGDWPAEADLATLDPRTGSPAEDRPIVPAEEDGPIEGPATGPDRRPDDSDLWWTAPGLLPQPESMLGVDALAGADPSPGRRAESLPVSRPEPPVGPRSTDPEPADSPPTVRRFEPESGDDRDQPDPPLLMTDAPPEVEEATGAPAESQPGDPPIRPGAMQVAPAPRPDPPEPGAGIEAIPEVEELPDDPFIGLEPDLPEPSPLPQPMPMEAPTPPAVPGRDEAGDVLSTPEEGSEPVARSAPETPRLDPGPEVDRSSLADMPDGGPGGGGHDDPPVVRWADLPPPGRLASGDAEGPKVEADGPGRWPFGLLKRFRGDRVEATRDPGVEPVVRFDYGRHRLDDFTLPGLDGKPFRLREHESDYVLLCFWGTWCDPCLAAMPHLAELQRQFDPKRLRVVAIAYERGGEGGPRAVSRAVRRLGLNYPVLLAPADGSCPVARSMEVQYYPSLVLLDREGRVVHRETGATGEKLMRLDRAVAAAMDGPVVTVTRR